jgi:hypothetical protein
MLKKSKMILIVFMLIGITFSAMADKGIGKKGKSNVTLNINTTGNSLRNAVTLNLKSGLKYTGSLLISQMQINGNTFSTNSLLTYQKGNTVYVIPQKQIIVVPDMKQGYTGMKLIIKTH